MNRRKTVTDALVVILTFDWTNFTTMMKIKQSARNVAVGIVTFIK